MPLKVPKLPNYPYVQKNTLYKVIIHSNVQALFTRIPFKHKFLSLSLSLSPSSSSFFFFFFFVCFCFCFFFFFFCYRPFLPQRWLLRLLCVNPQHKRDQFILTFAEPPPPPLVPSSSVQNPNLHYHLNLPVKSIHPLIPLIVVSAA